MRSCPESCRGAAKLLGEALPEPSPLRAALRAAIRAEEGELVRALAEEARFAPAALDRIAEQAGRLVAEVCRRRRAQGGTAPSRATRSAAMK